MATVTVAGEEFCDTVAGEEFCDARICSHRLTNKIFQMEAVQRSFAVECSICLEVVYSKRRARYFGILSECSHSFCYKCITQWRKRNKNCPTCRVRSQLAVKSRVWIDGQQHPTEKHDLIQLHRGCRSRTTSMAAQQDQATTPARSHLQTGTSIESH